MDLKFKDNSKLKFRYTQLEYIASTGTQYIDTGIKLTDEIDFDLEYELTVVDANKWFFGGADHWDKNGIYLTNWNDGYFCIGTKNSSCVRYSINTNNYTKHKVVYRANDYLSFDGTVSSLSSVTYESSKNCIVFGAFEGRSNRVDKLSQKIYSVTFYSNNLKILDLVPAKDGSGVVCLYDTVSETFFYNQGTGDFVAGPVVNLGLPANILLKTTTLYHKNTPNVNGLQLLNGILSVQETAEDVVLNRIRVDIGNVSGSLSELLQYAGMAGFNDNYEPQTKPRLVGTFTVNDWYTTTQPAQAQAAFDGLTIVENPNYLLDFSQMAVQCLDDTQPNYNPALSIILSEHNVGHILTKPIKQGCGRYMLKKSEAAIIPNIGTSWKDGWFINKGTVVDSNNIIDGGSYDFEEFTEFQYFTSVTTIPDCANAIQMQYCAFSCNKLKTIVLPSSLTYIGTGAFNCPLEGDILIPTGVTELKQKCFAATMANVIVHNQITKFGPDCFGSNATIDRFPSNLTTLDSPNYAKIYRNDYTLPATCVNMSYGRTWSGSPLLNNCVHWLAPALTSASYNAINSHYHFEGVSKVYVGTGEDKDADDAILAEYQSHLTNVANKFDTWYNYLHP